MYLLEVQYYIENWEKEINGKFEHVGYMNKIFKNKNEAIKYYNEKNPHMRNINIHGNCVSDWDPNTRLRYIIREYNGEIMKIEPFL